MKLAKSSVQALDLDELARQIQEAAMSALPKSARPEKPETGDIASQAPESDAESIKGMGTTPEKDTAAARSDINYDKALRSIAGGLAHMPRPVIRRAGTMDFATVRGEVKPAPTPAAPTPAASTPAAPKPAADDLEASIAQALRDEFASSSARAETAPRVEPAPPAAAPAPVNEDEFGHPAETWEDRHEDMVGFANEGPDYWSDEHEQLQESADLPSADLPSAPPAPAKRGLASPHALALSAALFLIALGVGAAVAIRVLPLDGLPGIFAGKPVEAPSASSEAKVASSEASAPMTASAADQPGSDASVPAPSSTAPSPATAPAVPAAASSDLGPTKASDASSPAAVASAASPAQSATTPIPAPAPAPAPLVTARTANAPAAETPQPAASAPDFGAPRRVATIPVKPEPSANDGSKGDGATPAAPMASASAAADDASQQPEVETAPALPPRRPAELQRTPASRIVAAAEERKTSKPPRAPAKVAANVSAQPPQAQAQAPAPNAAGQAGGQSSGVRGFLHQVFDNQPGAAPNVPPPGASHPVAAARPAQPQAAQPGGTTSIARSEPSAPSGPSVSIKLASSVSEQRAQATLSRLQKQFPGVLGGASVRREDLGKFGVFYRVRVNPMPREAADKVCAQLKASGASCALSGG